MYDDIDELLPGQLPEAILVMTTEVIECARLFVVDPRHVPETEWSIHKLSERFETVLAKRVYLHITRHLT